MRRRLVIGSLIALALVWVLPASAADGVRYDDEFDVTIVDDEEDEKEMKFRVTGQVRGRYEYLWNYLTQDPDDSDNFDVVPYRAQIGVLGRFTDNVYGYIDLQAFGAMGDSIPDSSSQNPFTQAVTTDALGATTVQLYQAFLEMKNIGGGDFDLRFGRAEHIMGNELQMGNSDFYNGLAFDGFRGWYNREDWNLQGYYYWAVERNVPVGDPFFFGCTADVIDEPCNIGIDPSNVDSRVGGLDFTWTFNPEKRHYIKAYLIQNASRQEAAFDGFGNHRLNTFGVLWKHDIQEGSGLDWSAEVAMQFGEAMFDAGVPDVDFGGTIFEGWVGYKLGRAHRIRLGGLVASGQSADDDSSEFNGWIPLFTDVHQDNRLGNLDLFNGTLYTDGSLFGSLNGLTMSNVTNINLRYEFMSGKNYALIALHDFRFTEDLEGGPVSLSDIGQEIDLEYRFQYTKHLSWEIAYSYLIPGDWFDAQVGPNTDAEDISRFWLQANLKW